MAQKPRLAKRALALLLAAMMAVSSFQVTTYAADSSMTVTGGSAGLIDDPLSGETGSGWDNIDSGTGTPAPALQSAAGNTALPPAPIPENPLAGRFLQGGARVFSLTIWVLCGIIIRYRYVYLLGIPLKIKSDTGGQLP